jgi:hypothetical protein
MSFTPRGDTASGFSIIRRVVRIAALAIACGSVAAPPAAAQAPAAQPASTVRALTVAGEVAHPLTLTADELKVMPRTTVEIKEEGRTIAYEGVLVGEVLKRAGAPVGSELRGNAVASYVVASAQDGYQGVLARRARSRVHQQRHHRCRDYRPQTALRLPGTVPARGAEGFARRAIRPHARADRSRTPPKVAA